MRLPKFKNWKREEEAIQEEDNIIPTTSELPPLTELPSFKLDPDIELQVIQQKTFSEDQPSEVISRDHPLDKTVCVVCGSRATLRCHDCQSYIIAYCSASCQAIDWPEHQKVCEKKPRVVIVDRTATTVSRETDIMNDLTFYAHQVWLILLPVAFCMAIVIWGVKTIAATGILRSGYISVYDVPSDASSGQIFTGAFINALVMIGAIVGATILVVILFIFRCFKVSCSRELMCEGRREIKEKGLIKPSIRH
jgi:hypothetical protein